MKSIQIFPLTNHDALHMVSPLSQFILLAGYSIGVGVY